MESQQLNAHLMMGLICSLSEPTFGQESTASGDPFGPSTFGSTDSGAHSTADAHSNGFCADAFSPAPSTSSQVCPCNPAADNHV